MDTLPTLMSDLAMILFTAGIATLLCRKLNQPLVLGYLVAGFLTGPNFYLFPTITNPKNVELWGDIGIIFLLFSLGLEFSLPKLKKVGKTSLITVCVEFLSFFVLGYACGSLLGWEELDCLFLGSLLSMSSTAVVIKAFEDLDLRKESFASSVFGLLIMEDMVGIIVMVLLSTCATTDISSISAYTILHAIISLLFFILVCGILAIYLFPTFFRKTAKYFSDEVTLISSLGICFGMVALCSYLQFSTALGAFITGSLLTATSDSRQLQKMLLPLKYLFGAVFFISVGMMVNLATLSTYAFPILVLTLAVLGGKMFFTSTGFLLSGQSLRTALAGGMSLTQLGEFSLIASQLGSDLGVLNPDLASILVPVAVITIFTTPFFMRSASPFYSKLTELLTPEQLSKINTYATRTPQQDERNKTWNNYLHQYFVRVALQCIVCFTLYLLAFYIIMPTCDRLLSEPYSTYVATVIALLMLSPFLRTLLSSSKETSKLGSLLWFQKRSNHLPLTVLYAIKIIIAVLFLNFILQNFLDLTSGPALLASILLAALIASSTKLLEEYVSLETRFIINFKNQEYATNAVADEKIGQQKSLQNLGEQIYFRQYSVLNVQALPGTSLKALASRETFGFNILQIKKEDGRMLIIPGPLDTIDNGDVLLLLGTSAQFAAFDRSSQAHAFQLVEGLNNLTIEEYMRLPSDIIPAQQRFYPCVIGINKNSSILGKSLRSSALRNKWHCLALGLERNNYVMINPNVALVMEKDDLLWLIGKKNMLDALISEGIL